MSEGTTLSPSPAIYGRTARDLLGRTHRRDLRGARAALETFYHAFNAGDLQLLLSVWADDALIQSDSPLRGVARGLEQVAALYRPLLLGGGLTWLQFDDVVEISTEESVVFTGVERGILAAADDVVPLRIRTTRCFGWIEAAAAWRLVHHHGSIDEPMSLTRYQRAAGFLTTPAWPRNAAGGL